MKREKLEFRSVLVCVCVLPVLLTAAHKAYLICIHWECEVEVNINREHLYSMCNGKVAVSNTYFAFKKKWNAERTDPTKAHQDLNSY